MVDIRAVLLLGPAIIRDELKEVSELAGMMLLRKGSYPAAQPVSSHDWEAIVALRA